MTRFILVFGALWGLSGVALAALFDHALAAYASHGVETALRYHQLYAVFIVLLGLAADSDERKGWLALPTILFLAGSVIFCMALYLAALTGITGFVYATPVGGILLMAAWAAFAFAAFRRWRSVV